MNNRQEVFKIKETTDFSFIGLLRNEKKFEIGHMVFFSATRYSAKNFFYGRIIGKELGGSDYPNNPEYIYKIEIVKDGCGSLDRELISKVRCESIFFTEQEAKESALKEAKKIYDITVNRIEKCFCKRTIA